MNLAGSSVSTVVLPLLVYERTGSPALTAGLAAIRVVPYLAVGLVAGPLADRADRKRLIVGGNVLQGVAMAVIPVWDTFTPVSVAVVYVASLCASTMFVFTDAAVFGAIPNLVPPEYLPAANGMLASLSSAIEVAGPALAALLAGALGPAHAVWVDAATFFVAAALLMGVRVPLRVGPPPESRRLRAEIGEGLRFIRANRTILTLLIAGFGNSLAFGSVLGLLVVYAVRTLGFETGDVQIGLLFSAGAIGSLVSGLLFARVFRRERVPWLSPLTMVLAGLATAGLAVLSTFVGAAIVYFAISAFVAMTITVGITYRMLATPDGLRSRVNVVGRMVAWGGQPFGAAFGGILAQATSVRVSLLAAGGIFTVSGVGARLALRRGASRP